LIYQVWQRSDSPEAFYGCADVVFGQTGAAAAQAAPKAPTDAQIAAGESRSTVSHHGHGGTEPIATSDVADARPAGATLEAALSGSAVLASGALGLLFWSRRKAGTRARV
jgi:chitin-binding protein